MEKFNLVPAFDETGKTYNLAHYEQIVEACKKYTNEIIANNDKEIVSDDKFKEVKDVRTEVRSQLENITETRLKITRALIGNFENQLKTLEKDLKECDYKLKARVDEYKNKKKAPEPETFKLVIISFNKEKIDKIKEQALKYGCSVKEEK